MLLVAVVTWKSILSQAQGPLTIHGDAKGVLQAVVRRRARNAALVVAEIQLVLGFIAYDLTAVHFWSEENGTCDALSRLSEGAAFPPDLRGAVPCTAGRRTPWRFLRGGHKLAPWIANK